MDMIDYARSIVMGERPLQPDAPTKAEVAANAERAERQTGTYVAAVDEVMSGTGEFWPTNNWWCASDAPKWDAEQYLPVFCAVQKALAKPGLTDCDRWQLVLNAVLAEAAKYAEAKAKAKAEVAL